MTYEYQLSSRDEDAHDPAVSEEMNDRAFAALVAQCHAEEGKVRRGWLEFCYECREVTAEQFIDGLRAVGQEWWEEAVQEQWAELYEATE